MQLALDSRLKALERYFERAAKSDIPEDVQSELARFGVVLICGYIERCVEIIIMHRLEKKGHELVLNFVKSYFKKGTNYDGEAIKKLLERFNDKWPKNFQKFLDDNDDVRTAILSAYGVRNSVAHGGTNSAGLTRAQELLSQAKRLVEGVVNATK